MMSKAQLWGTGLEYILLRNPEEDCTTHTSKTLTLFHGKTSKFSNSVVMDNGIQMPLKSSPMSQCKMKKKNFMSNHFQCTKHTLLKTKRTPKLYSLYWGYAHTLKWCTTPPYRVRNKSTVQKNTSIPRMPGRGTAQQCSFETVILKNFIPRLKS